MHPSIFLCHLSFFISNLLCNSNFFCLHVIATNYSSFSLSLLPTPPARILSCTLTVLLIPSAKVKIIPCLTSQIQHRLDKKPQISFTGSSFPHHYTFLYLFNNNKKNVPSILWCPSRRVLFETIVRYTHTLSQTDEGQHLHHHSWACSAQCTKSTCDNMVLCTSYCTQETALHYT